MSPVGGAPVNAQPDQHNSKDQENHLIILKLFMVKLSMIKLLMVNDQNTDGYNDHNEYDVIKEEWVTKQIAQPDSLIWDGEEEDDYDGDQDSDGDHQADSFLNDKGAPLLRKLLDLLPRDNRGVWPVHDSWRR